jgi:hypothetical protein
MTAPVMMDKPESEKVEMTAPVFETGWDEGTKMSFVLPKKFSIESAPIPTDENVKLVELPKRKRLVYSFSGFLNEKKINEGKVALWDYADKNGIAVLASSLTSAGYNPPWTLPWLRRNEVMVDIASN